MVVRPPQQRGLVIGLLLILLILVLDVGLVGLIRLAPNGIVTLMLGLVLTLSLAPIGWILFHMAGLRGMLYTLTEDTVTIHWYDSQRVIPLGSIDRVLTGEELAWAINRPQLFWPGMVVGTGHIEGIGLTHFYATSTSRDLVVLVAAGEGYAVSPADKARFLRQVEARRVTVNELLEDAPAPTPQYIPPGFLSWPIWGDTLAHLLLGLALAGNLILCGYLVLRFPGLPARIAIYYNASGKPAVLGPAQLIFILPIMSLLAFLVDAILGGILYSRPAHRNGAYILWSVGVLVQFMVWVGLIGVLSG